MSSSSCTYILKKGKNKGETCGIKSINNTLLCKKHSVDIIENESISDNADIQNKDENVEIKNIKPKNPKEPKEKKQKEPKEPKESKEPKEKKQKESKEKDKNEVKEVSKKLNIYDKQKIQAKRNKYNNYVLSNELVVHPVNKNIIGRQEEDKVIELSIEDIEYCKEHGFRYLQPSIMYFSDSEVEKKEVELHKLMLKSQNNNNDNEDTLEDEESENESENENENEN